MRQRKDIIFRTVVAHGKGHGVMIIFTEIGIQLHVLPQKSCIHPIFHLKLKSRPPLSIGPCNERLCGGFLRNCHNSGEGPSDDGVKMFENSMASRFLLPPNLLGTHSPSFAIVQIKHGSHGIHTQAVNMEFLNPEKEHWQSGNFYPRFCHS